MENMKLLEKIVKTIIFTLSTIVFIKVGFWAIGEIVKAPSVIVALLILAGHFIFTFIGMRLCEHIIETKI